MYSNSLSQANTRIKRFSATSGGATRSEYAIFAAGVGALLLVSIAVFAPNLYSFWRTFFYSTHEIKTKLEAERIGHILVGNIEGIQGITGMATWGTTTEPVAGWVGDNPIEIGATLLYAPTSGKPPSGSNLVIEIDGSPNASDVIRKDFSYIRPNTNIEIKIESALREISRSDINEDGIDVIWNGEQLTTVRAAEKGVWAVDKIAVNTSDGDGSGQLALASADNATSFDDGVGMLISDIKVTIIEE